VHLSFVRSVTMDKWKDTELNKMKVGGNKNAKQFLNSKDDWSDTANLTAKYNSRAAALYKDKITTEAGGDFWNEETSSAKNHKSSYMGSGGGAKTSNGGGSGERSSHNGSSRSGGMSSSNSYSSGMTQNGGGGGGYQSGAPAYGSAEFNSAKEDFFSKKQNENAMRRDDLPPSQGGKYAGFGSSCNNPPARSYSTQDFVTNNLGGLTQSLSAFSLSSAGSIGGRVAEVGWKFTSLAGQKAAELSENVTEKVKEGSLLTDITSGASSLAGKMTEVVGKKNFDLSSLWGSTRSEYQPCEDSGLLHTQGGGGGGYQDYQDRSPSSGDYGGRGQDNFSGFGNDDHGGFQSSSSRKDSDDWGNNWDDSGWSEPSPKSSVKATKSSKKSTKKEKPASEGLLIDFDGSGKAAAKADDWGNDWEDDAWESLNKDD